MKAAFITFTILFWSMSPCEGQPTSGQPSSGPTIGTPPNPPRLNQPISNPQNVPPYSNPANNPQNVPPYSNPVSNNSGTVVDQTLSFNPSGGWSMGKPNVQDFPVRRGSRVKITQTDQGVKMTDTRQSASLFTKTPQNKNQYTYAGTTDSNGQQSDPANATVIMVQTGNDTIEIQYPGTTYHLKRTSPPETLVKAKADLMKILDKSRESGGLAKAKYHNEFSAPADAHCQFLESVKFEETGNPLDAHWLGSIRFNEIESKLTGMGYQLDDHYRHSESCFVIQKNDPVALENMITLMRSSAQHWNNLMTPENTIYVIGASESSDKLYVTICVIPVR